MRRSDKPQVTADILRHLYFNEKLSLRQIGEKLDRHMSTIQNYFVRWGIERRSISEGKLLLPSKVPMETISEIIRLYKEGDGQGTIAKKLNVTEGCVHWQLVKNGIELRNVSEANLLAYQRGNQISHMLGLKGKLCPNYKGGIHDNGKGYTVILMPEYPRANKEGYILEHKLVWERVHNRPLPDGYHIHHINGIKNDNRPTNLLALPKKTHDRLIPELKKRIRQLEQEVKLLEKALDNSQMLFRLEEN